MDDAVAPEGVVTNIGVAAEPTDPEVAVSVMLGALIVCTLLGPEIEPAAVRETLPPLACACKTLANAKTIEPPLLVTEIEPPVIGTEVLIPLSMPAVAPR